MNASMILSFDRDINDPLITFCPATLLAREDRNANVIKLTVMDGNAPADLSGNTAVVLFQRPGDSYVVRCPGSVSGNVISVTLLGDCYLYAGQYYASLILNADGFTRTMLRLAGQIESNGDGPIIDPTGTIPGYEDIARIYAELEEALQQAETAISGANAAAQNATKAAGAANTAAGAANTAAGNANGATARANEASGSIEGLTVEASDVAYNQPATATVSDVEGHKHIAFGLRQGVPGAVPSITFTGETGEPNTDVVITQSGPPEAPIVNLKIPQGVPGTGNVSTVDGVVSDSGGNVALSAVRYVAQTLEDAQKVQARKNIGIDGQVYPCMASTLESLNSSDLVGIYNEGYRAIKTENNGTVVLLGLASDGSLEWLGCNQPRQNLLDNPDFSVAQAGYGGMHGTRQFAADRWSLWANGNITVTGSSGNLTLTLSGAAGSIAQRMPKGTFQSGKTYTCVFYTNQGIVFRPAITGNADYDAVDLTLSDGESITLHAATILEGSYTPKTLPPWEEPDYAMEYLKCLRYYRALTSYGRTVFKPYGEIAITIVSSDEMRILPTAVTVDLQVFDGTAIWVPATVASVSWMGDGYKVRVNVDGTVSNGNTYLMQGFTGLTADL